MFHEKKFILLFLTFPLFSSAEELSGIFSDPNAKVFSNGNISIPGGGKIESKNSWRSQKRGEYSIETQTKDGKFQSITELSLPEPGVMERLGNISKTIRKERRGLQMTYDSSGKLSSVTSCGMYYSKSSMLGGGKDSSQHACATVTQNRCAKLAAYFSNGTKAGELAACKKLHEEIRDLYNNSDDIKQINQNIEYLGQRMGFRSQPIDATKKVDVTIPEHTLELADTQSLCEQYSGAFANSAENVEETPEKAHNQ